MLINVFLRHEHFMMKLSMSNINQRAQENDKMGTKRGGKQIEKKRKLILLALYFFVNM